MSERKVLNKYYPPDFDPSQIPRCKEPRNRTFTIRLMAPCNMRCTTCGEYIYKGRKFNARKEDVDDMDHLGLKIFRFYIKCTACLSEISFRTDPANVDYVLEAGATRNFEALDKAMKAAEEEEKARKEELETNPMKLLEERTEASKNEMARLEALEELQELNKREIKINYDDLLGKYDKIREFEAKQQEAEDEEFVKKVFSNNVKRILDDDDEDSDEDQKKNPVKKVKAEKATDFLTFEDNRKSNEKKESWQKSIGTMGAPLKKSLGIVTKKRPLVAKSDKAASGDALVTKKSETSNGNACAKPKSSSLSLVGSYSDSDETSD